MPTTLEKILPTGKRWRELWLPQDIVGTHGPPSTPGGHPLTLTNQAAKRTTADGLLFHGAATDNVVIAAHVDHNNKAAFHITIRWTPTQNFSSASAADLVLFRKEADGTHYMTVFLESDTGKLHWKFVSAGTDFELTSTTVSWVAGTEYIITLTLNDAPVQRMLVNGTLEDSDTAAAANTPNGGAIVIGSSSDGGTDGFEGIISWIVIGTGATATVGLTTTADTGEEALLNKGIPPATAKVQYLLTLDEGGGLTANNRGSGTNNGVIDTGCTWAFSGVNQAVLSLDGINDYAVSPAAVDISGDITLIWVAKNKTTNDTLAAVHNRFLCRISANDYLTLYTDTGSRTVWGTSGGGTAVNATYTGTFTIDDYQILIGTESGGSLALFLNGLLIVTGSGAGVKSAAAATAYLGASSAPAGFDVCKPILVGLVDSALSAQEALALSRFINNWLGLGLKI